MATRWLAVCLALSFFAVAFILITVAFTTASWLVSERGFAGAPLNQFGLWTHCYNSIPDPYHSQQRQFFVGCRWIYDRFTTGYDIGFSVPGFMVATQVFFTICFICMLVGLILTVVYFLRCGPANPKIVLLVKVDAIITLVGAVCGAIAVIIFASLAIRHDRMPGQAYNFFGWSFVVACVGVVLAFIVAALLLTETSIQEKRRKHFNNLQTRYELENESRT